MIGFFLFALSAPARAETPEEWIEISRHVHGDFGTLIAVGLRIGLDALYRLEAKPGEVNVTYIDGATAPCPCVADGIMIATRATPGHGTMQVALVHPRPGLVGVAIVSRGIGGKTLRYEIPDRLLPVLLERNKTLDRRGRYDSVMKLPDLYTVTVQDR